jgi:hypothetical protein
LIGYGVYSYAQTQIDEARQYASTLSQDDSAEIGALTTSMERLQQGQTTGSPTPISEDYNLSIEGGEIYGNGGYGVSVHGGKVRAHNVKNHDNEKGGYEVEH